MSDRWSAESYARNARFVADLAASLVDDLAARPGEAILDLGCGDGAFTAMVAASGATVTGIDASPALVAAARTRGIDARVEDARELAYAAAFDAVVSNAALHWMLPPDSVLRGVSAALRPGGRFVAEFGGKGNVASIVTALVAVLDRRGVDGAAAIPWYFPTSADYAARLEEHGFTIERIALVPRPTPLATGMAAWLETFGGAFFSALPEHERAPAAAEAEALLAHALRDEAGNWTADYVRLRFRATKR